MFVLGLIVGLSIGLGIWGWQQIQLNRYLMRLVQPLVQSSTNKPPTNKRSTSKASTKGMLLLPQLRHSLQSFKRQHYTFQQELEAHQDILEHAPIGYLIVDEDHQLLWCNHQAQEILSLQRWQPEQIRLLLELVRSYELDRLIEQTRDRQKTQVKEWLFQQSSENPATMLEIKDKLLRAIAFPLPQNYVGVFLENLQPQQDLHQVRDRAFSDLAHELRTPLTSIRLVVETLQDRVSPPLDRWVERLMQEVDRLIGLVQSWLDLTQLETNPTIQLHRQPVEFHTLINSIWDTLEPLAQKQHIDFSYSGVDPLWINVDRERMHQIFINLLDNCIKYSPPHAKIQVQTKILPEKQITSDIPPRGSSLEINVIDSGVGFAETDLPHIFERFYRGDTARSRPDSLGVAPSLDPSAQNKNIIGSGLGLAIVRQIVIAHGGSIKAMNHPQTGGAWLQIELPNVIAS